MKEDLQKFVEELLQAPIQTERYHASFVQTAPNGGELRFQHAHSDKKAMIHWKADKEQDQIYGKLVYNGRFVLLKAESCRFKKEIIEKLPVF